MMRRSKYDATTLGAAVASSHTLSDVMRKLGLTPNGGNHRMIASLVRQHGIDTSHFDWGRLRRVVNGVAVERLAALVSESTSFAQILAELDLPTEGRAHRELVTRVSKLGLDTKHFRGRGWSRGDTQATNPNVARIARMNRRSNEEVFVENSPETKGPNLKKRLLALGWADACACCGISEWLGKPLVLHVDHKNGINNDNRFENLRFLCPNCHSQTDTYCNRTRPQASQAREPRARYTWYMSPQASVA